ncbi:hypothetical protein ACFRJ1_15940 [Streptomyces sp. NPDC056773]|uniref:hypothetical protein n=1 Tax=unclassified Streptomyces TaxID=2593676 RepID=UPI00369368BD
MSEDVLSIIPSDPQWQPDRDAVDHVIALVEELTPGVADGVDVEIDVTSRGRADGAGRPPGPSGEANPGPHLNLGSSGGLQSHQGGGSRRR